MLSLYQGPGSLGRRNSMPVLQAALAEDIKALGYYIEDDDEDHEVSVVGCARCAEAASKCRLMEEALEDAQATLAAKQQRVYVRQACMKLSLVAA